MTQAHPPMPLYPPRDATPAARIAYEVNAYYWAHTQRVSEEDAIEVSVEAPGFQKHTVITVRSATDSLLAIEAYGDDDKYRMLFLPCAPLEFR